MSWKYFKLKDAFFLVDENDLLNARNSDEKLMKKNTQNVKSYRERSLIFQQNILNNCFNSHRPVSDVDTVFVDEYKCGAAWSTCVPQKKGSCHT